PVEQYGIDAAILYKDIMTPLPAMGIDVEIVSGVGPVIDNPLKNKTDIENLRKLEPEDDIDYILNTIKLLTEEQLNVPLIGFSGAPIILAHNMIERVLCKYYAKTKVFMYNEHELWFMLIDKLAVQIITYATAQVKAGVSAMQIFDSWVGSLIDS